MRQKFAICITLTFILTSIAVGQTRRNTSYLAGGDVHGDFEIGGGYRYTDNSSLVNWAVLNAGNNASNPPYNSYDYLHISLGLIKKKTCFSIELNESMNKVLNIGQWSVAYGITTHFRNSHALLLTKVHLGLQGVSFDDHTKPQPIKNVYNGYTNEGFYTGLSTKLILFLSSDESWFVGIQPGIEYRFINFGWAYGYGSGSYWGAGHTHSTLGVPDGTNFAGYIKITFGYAL
jgi:hypothetical protein